MTADSLGNMCYLRTFDPATCPPVAVDLANPVFNVPASLLCVPAITLPLLQSNNLPLGLQVIGYQHADEDLFGIAAWLMQALA
jgi:Asp-tRNA(Asn)/Glu-tRNA(Gln) amidotransferase A subunit family amidase